MAYYGKATKIDDSIPFWKKITKEDIARFLRAASDIMDTYIDMTTRPPRGIDPSKDDGQEGE